MENILNISEAGSLALHAIVYLADSENGKMSNKDIAADLAVSESHLSKVLQRLVKAGLITSNRGPKGGFRLAREAESITLLEVYEAIEGRLPNGNCLIAPGSCSGGKCILGSLLRKLNTEVRDYMENTRLSDLSDVYEREGTCLA